MGACYPGKKAGREKLSNCKKKASHGARLLHSGSLGGFAGGDSVRGRAVDIESPNDGLCLKQVPYHLVDGGILLPVVPFGIFSAVPKAQCQDAIGFRIRYQ